MEERIIIDAAALDDARAQLSGLGRQLEAYQATMQRCVSSCRTEDAPPELLNAAYRLSKVSAFLDETVDFAERIARALQQVSLRFSETEKQLCATAEALDASDGKNANRNTTSGDLPESMLSVCSFLDISSMMMIGVRTVHNQWDTIDYGGIAASLGAVNAEEPLYVPEWL
ncbi:MAG: hypothetical protein IJ343_01065 [Clostridia bacterium]|nr:hypothetical protein [Clostridia bacterium]